MKISSFCRLLLLAILAVSNSSARAELLPGLISRWAGDGTASDSAGTNHGIMQNGAAFGAGVDGQAFSLDGVDDYVRVPFSPTFDFSATNAFTVMTWVNPRVVGAFGAVVVKCPPNAQWDWGIYWNANGTFAAGRHLQIAVQSSTGYPTGQWHHVAFSYDAGAWALYVDGALHGMNSGIFVSQSTGPLAFGRKGGSSGNDDWFGGLVDDVQIFNRALSNTEIKRVFDAVASTNLAPSVSAQPQSQSVKEGESVSFTVDATGTAPLAYQWLLNGSNIVGAVTPAFTISRAQLQDVGSYSVMVSNMAGTITSTNAALAVLPASLFEWAASGTTSFSAPSAVMGMATDSAENCYASGPSRNVSKFDSSGTLQWVRSVGLPAAVAADTAGNIFVTGGFASNTITLGSVTLTNNNFPGSESFLTKLDRNGNFLWAKATGPNPNVYNNVITVTPAGHPVVVRGAQVTKYDTHGSEMWTHENIGAGSVTGVGADRDSNIFIGGYGTGNRVLKYSSTGDLVRSNLVSGSGGRVFALATTASGECFVTGQIDATNMTWGSVVLTNGKQNDIFVAKLDATGAVVWAKSAGGAGIDIPHGIGVDAAGNCYVAGGFSTPATFDWASVVSSGDRDVFVTKYSSAGDVRWARRAGGSGTDNALALAVNAAGDCFITGSRSPVAWFGDRKSVV